MREIKFRAWDKKLKRMVYRDSDFGSLSRERSNKIDQPWDNPYEVDEWYPATAIRGIFDYFDDIAKDDNFIVEQYTGLKDKNGVEIYEGDVVAVVDPFSIKGVLHEVVYYNAAYWFRPLKRLNVERGDSPIAGAFSGCEVVGNIHENPELSEKE